MDERQEAHFLFSGVPVALVYDHNEITISSSHGNRALRERALAVISSVLKQEIKQNINQPEGSASALVIIPEYKSAFAPAQNVDVTFEYVAK